MTKPTVIISQEAGRVVIRTQCTFKNTEISFFLGEEFDEISVDDRKCKVRKVTSAGIREGGGEVARASFSRSWVVEKLWRLCYGLNSDHG